MGKREKSPANSFLSLADDPCDCFENPGKRYTNTGREEMHVSVFQGERGDRQVMMEKK